MSTIPTRLCLDGLMCSDLQVWKWRRRGWSDPHNWVNKVE